MKFLIKSFDEFIDFYENHGFCINDINRIKSDKKLNKIQLESKYKKYLKQEEKRRDRKERNNNTIIEKQESKFIELELEQEEWKKIYDIVDERDNYSCRLMKILSYKEKEELKKNSGGLYKIIDKAHILRRSQYPDLIKNENNIINLNRASHSWIDNYRNPINGKMINKEECLEFWYRIVGKEYFMDLLYTSKYYKNYI